jgi:diadenosine tetraphosphate (Ap4A) HIT family hydrolase
MTALERLWAGWRSSYIEQITTTPRPDPSVPEGCVFCAILASGLPDEETHVLWRHPGGLAVAIINAYPYGSGHMMVMPRRHAAGPEDLASDESAAVWGGVTDAVRAVRAAYDPDGVNLGANLGHAAGAGVPGHFHVHVLPRWSGDTNFMTSIAEARVLPEPLAVSASRIRAAWPG